MNLTSAAAPRVLIIEDDPALGAHMQQQLEGWGFTTTWRQTGPEGLQEAQGQAYALVLLDVLLPGLQGLELLGRLRLEHGTPVILLSALGSEADRIDGFARGADDYLPKPFSMAELRVRIDAILRRVALERQRLAPLCTAPSELRFDDLRSDVCCSGQWVGLTASEYRVLETLWRHAEEVLSKAFLYQQGLHRAYTAHDRSLDMHVSQIRRKLIRCGYASRQIHTVWGKGYVLTGQGSAHAE
ncbi:MAG: response regulator transcription factor [Pseudomonas sp.]|uniref:response regulator transcription factor n=1 Tax=Pseudomonas sp. TaxID=306 RepID=UPI003395E084